MVKQSLGVNPKTFYSSARKRNLIALVWVVSSLQREAAGKTQKIDV
jgi:hypothetical protein